MCVYVCVFGGRAVLVCFGMLIGYIGDQVVGVHILSTFRELLSTHRCQKTVHGHTASCRYKEEGTRHDRTYLRISGNRPLAIR